MLTDDERIQRRREKQRRYYLAHRDTELVRMRAYSTAHLDAKKERYRKRRARLKAAGIREVSHRIYDPVKSHESRLRRCFGITKAQYDALLVAQGGKCAICRTEKSRDGRRFAVDHDHITGVIRGLLCTDCNRGLGLFRDNPTSLARASEYITYHRCPVV